VSAVNVILDGGYGKPPQFSAGDKSRFKKAVDETDDELNEAIALFRTEELEEDQFH
jgi:hypothetical protein